MKKLLSILTVMLSLVTISYGQATDLKVVSLTAPTDGCDLKINEDVKIRVQNVGATQIFGNVTFTYILDGGTPVTELVTGATILPQAFYIHTFNTKADLSAVTSFSFTLAATVANDVSAANDTLKNQVVSNLVLPFPYFNDFSTFPNNALGNLPEGFVSSPDALTSYSWRVRNSNTNIATGPQTDNTPSPAPVKFLMVDGSQGSGGNESTFESPCVSLLGVSTPVLEFYYHMHGIHMGTLYVEAKSDQFPSWARLDSIVGRQQTSRSQPWRKKSIGLTQFAGQFMTFRFVAKRSSAGNNGNMAIDDIGIVLPDTGQVQLVDINSPTTGLCNYTNCEPVKFRVKNVGNDTLKSIQAEYTIDGGTPVTQTFPVSIAPFRSTSLTFSQCADLSIPKTYTIAGKLTLSTDTDTTDNIFSISVDHLAPITVPYFEDFESFNQSTASSAPNNTGNHANGWTTNPTFSASTSAFKWIVGRGVASPGGATGPNKDHTRGNSIGKYFYADGNEGSPFQVTYLETTCIDFTNVLAPRLKYWYHRFGFDMGDMYVEVDSDQGWVKVDSLKGQQQNTSGDAWELRTVDIESQVKGKQARIRFVGIKGGTGFASTMALDDIFIYDLTDIDVGPVRMVSPDTTRFTCYNNNQEFGVLIQNFGSQDVDFTVDSTKFSVFVTKNGTPWDTATYVLKDNNFHEGLVLKTDEIDTVFFTGVDMSEIGADYGFTIVTDMLTGLDTVPGTDTIRPDNITTRRTAGVAFSSATTVCEGTGVILSDTSFFGAIQWQRQVGTQWFDEFGPNRDSALYVVLPPNAVNTYRAKICDSTYSNILTVNVTKVPLPTAIGDTICGPGQINLGAIQPAGVTRVFWYSDPVAPGVLTFGTSYSRNLDTTSVFYIGAQKDSCFSGRVPVRGVVASFPTIEFEGLDTIICSDTTYYINAGANLGLNATYQWSSNDPNVNGKVIQTIGVDPTRLNLNTEYWYSVRVLSNGLCETVSDSVKITITDTCKVGLNDFTQLGNLSVFPNPTNGMVTLKIETEQANQANLQIISMKGEVIFEKQGINTLGFNEQFDLSNYSKGIYYLRLISNKESVVKKIILR